jgi:hypothetical protein
MANHTFLMNEFQVLASLHSQLSLERHQQGWMKRFLGSTPDCMNVIADKTCGWREEEFT